MATSRRIYSLIVNRPLAGKDAMKLCGDLSVLPYHEIDGLELSLKHVERIDATGVAVLVRIYSHLMRTGRSFVVIDVPQRVMRVLTVSGLDGVIRTAAAEMQVGDPALTTDSGLFRTSESGIFRL